MYNRFSILIPGTNFGYFSSFLKSKIETFFKINFALFLLAQLRIEEITRMLRTGELGIPGNIEDRSPSPEPVYDNQGKRLNTREVRTRAKLDAERHKLVLEMLKLNPEYKPPADYKYLIYLLNNKKKIHIYIYNKLLIVFS